MQSYFFSITSDATGPDKTATEKRLGLFSVIFLFF